MNQDYKGVTYTLLFVRRRYGAQFYTWVYVVLAGEQVSSGDPFPKLNLSKKDREFAIELALERKEKKS